LAAADVVAIARTVLFRRVRSVLIRAHGGGLIAQQPMEKFAALCAVVRALS
jgi:non-homologous end joining protein Ku